MRLFRNVTTGRPLPIAQISGALRDDDAANVIRMTADEITATLSLDCFERKARGSGAGSRQRGRLRPGRHATRESGLGRHARARGWGKWVHEAQ